MAAALTASLSSLGTLTIRGTEGADQISVRQINGQISVAGTFISQTSSSSSTVGGVTIGSSSASLSTYVPAGSVNRIVVYGAQGNDTIDLTGLGMRILSQGTELHGGDGNDTILGTAGQDYLFGEAGNDFLDGRAGNDFLYGGSGGDVINDVVGSNTFSSGESDGRLTIYANFDGSSITYKELQAWGGKDWSADNFDKNHDGLLVKGYLAGQANREEVIGKVLTLLQGDFASFNINVVRITGKAVTGQKTTTIFVGEAAIDGASSTLRGRASDVDVGNDNATDVAFLTKTYGKKGATAAELAQYTANTSAHEIGHTLGLYHVDNQGLNELMRAGGQMSEDQNAHNNLTFLDKSLNRAENNDAGGVTLVTEQAYTTIKVFGSTVRVPAGMQYVTQNSFDTVLTNVGEASLLSKISGSGGSSVSASDEFKKLPCTCPFCQGVPDETVAAADPLQAAVQSFSAAPTSKPASLWVDAVGVVVEPVAVGAKSSALCS